MFIILGNNYQGLPGASCKYYVTYIHLKHKVSDFKTHITQFKILR